MTGLLRVLCLHGYMQNAQGFRARTGAFRKLMKSKLDLVYVTAPHKATAVQPPPVADGTQADYEIERFDSDAAAWWNETSDDVWGDIRTSAKFLAGEIRDKGPFDGILGFSQGASMAAIMMALIQAGHKAPHVPSKNPEPLELVREIGTSCPKFKFAMLFAGFYVNMREFVDLIKYSGPIHGRNIHIGGRKDMIVPMIRSRRLGVLAFTKPVVVVHTQGHYVPMDADSCSEYRKFIDDVAPHILKRRAESSVDSSEEKPSS
ncbi:Ovarian cancer-associated protein 2 [Coemansia guatemalensis]|uniref:Ovarian cancer-associated protein 2 n=1 Tax=Coemansia guatemalensis TaxID=2761395 RepID=A0A9W8HPZ2_9FUNG|nr:Ovarian cancer-associated protein 2 [Coemansia guatemalensis]